MKLKEILPNVYLFEFPNQFELCFTFFRIQEFYESPIKKIRGQYFTLERAIEAYAYLDLKDKKKEKFSYFSDWSGFNIPGHILQDFSFLFDDLTFRESELIENIEIAIDNNLEEIYENFYVIGAVKGEIEIIHHEIAHALFYLNKDYKKEMVKLVNKIPKNIRKRVEKSLINIGYSKHVLVDELQAYFSTGLRDNMLTEKQLEKNQGLINEFKNTFNKIIRQKYGTAYIEQRSI